MATKVTKGVPLRHHSKAKIARHKRCWENSQRRKERNKRKKGHRRLRKEDK